MQNEYPCMVVSDNDTELAANAILRWQEERTVEWHSIVQGRPMQDGLVESFNRQHTSLAGLTSREYFNRSCEDQIRNRANF